MRRLQTSDIRGVIESCNKTMKLRVSVTNFRFKETTISSCIQTDIEDVRRSTA